jgi:hypothetical protein
VVFGFLPLTTVASLTVGVIVAAFRLRVVGSLGARLVGVALLVTVALVAGPWTILAVIVVVFIAVVALLLGATVALLIFSITGITGLLISVLAARVFGLRAGLVLLILVLVLLGRSVEALALGLVVVGFLLVAHC